MAAPAAASRQTAAARLIVSRACAGLRLAGDRVRANEMKAYMRGQYTFFGVQAVARRRCFAAALREARVTDKDLNAASLLLQMQAWAGAPISPAECRFGLMAALKKLTPTCDANRPKFNDVMATAQQLQSILCGVSVPGVPAGGFSRGTLMKPP